MLTRSLCCFRGVSPEAERKLWRAGCLDWSGLPAVGRALSPRKTMDLARQLPEARMALEGRVADYFLRRLPVGFRPRVVPDFGDGVAFLDVETTGLGARDDVTVVGVWQAGKLRQFVRGIDLSAFLGCWRRIEVLVTFNGATFDLPVVLRGFGLNCPPPHVDLMHEARCYGYAGGLKGVERALGIRRQQEEEGDGRMAVDLWRRHAIEGDEESLAKLLKYNARDVLSLVEVTRCLWRRSFDSYPGPLPGLSLQADRGSLTTELLDKPPTG